MAAARSSSPGNARCPYRFTLRDLLVLMLLIGLGLGWWTDRRRMESRLELAELRILHLRADQRNYRALQEELRQRLAEAESAASTATPHDRPPPFSAAEELTAFVRTGPPLGFPPQGRAYHWFASPVRDARGTLAAQEAVPELADLLADHDEHVRARAAWAVGVVAEPHPEVTSKLIPLLDDPAPTVQWHAANALGEFRAAAEAAIPALEALMQEDECPIAAFATVCITRIDSRRTFGPRLAQLAVNRHSQNRKQAILQLRYHMPHDEVAQVLTTAFASEGDPEVRNTIAIVLNQLRH
jgi:hypothetical protein